MPHNRRWTRLYAIVIILTLILSLFSPAPALADPLPQTTLAVPPSVLIGEPLQFTVTFDNNGTVPPTTGFGPYIDLFLPAAGADGDDGIVFVSASFLGAALTPFVAPFTCTTGTFTHPMTNLITPCVVGTQVVILELPFGSFTADQPPAVVTVNAALSPLADADVPLTIRASSGFRYGNTATGSTPIVQASPTTANTTPTIMLLTKTYIGPEDETATGPNFPRQYRLTVDIATGQTVTNLDITDLLPNNMQFIAVDSTTINGAPAGTTAIATPSTTIPGGTLTRRFASVTGTSGADDAEMVFSFYIPRLDAGGAAVIDPATGDDAISDDNASAQGNWTPIDPRDPPTLVTANTTATPSHRLTDKSIAVQKGVTIVNDVSPSGLSVGDTLEYTLNFQISDFFAFQNLVLDDFFSDGQRYDGTFTPQMSVNGNPFALPAAAINAGNFTVGVRSPVTGETQISFRISDEMITRGQNGQLLGGCVLPTGTGNPPPDCTVYNDGPTTGQIRFRTVVENSYQYQPVAGASVNQGDVLGNRALINGDVLSTADRTPTGFSEADDTGSSLQIATGVIDKTIYALNGNTTLPSPVRVAAGDVVTYRIQYSLPTSDITNLRLDDFLPLPIFAATEVTTFNPTVSAAAPPAGQGKFGPADTFFAFSGQVPTVSSNATGNFVTFDYGTFNSDPNVTTLIDILFSVTVLSDPFVDGLFLTNQAQAREESTTGVVVSTGSIVQIQITQPVLNIRKGVVGTDRAGATFVPGTAPLPSTVFAQPPSAACPRFSGVINSGNVASLTNRDLTGIDAGDTVTFVIAVENTGSGLNGAFDVTIRDTIPAGFGPATNLCVTDGAGSPMPFTAIGGGLFDPAGGIVLDDPGPTAVPAGALDPGTVAGVPVTTGRNIAIITYDLVAQTSVVPRQALVNTASLVNYANTEGGPNFVPTPLTDTASVTVRDPASSKSLIGTEINSGNNGNTQAVIGELVSYSVTLTIPEGTVPNARVVDTLPTGLAFVDFVGLTNSNPAQVTLGQTPDPANTGTGVTNNPRITASGRTITFEFGTITNTNTDNAVAETITLEYRVVVLNVVGNQAGTNLRNSAVFSWTDTTDPGSTRRSLGAARAPFVQVVEPNVTINKTISPGAAQAGDPITYTITLRNTSGIDAHDVTLTDVIPALISGPTIGTVTDDVVAPGVPVTAANFSLVGNNLSTVTAFDMLTSAVNGSGQPRTITLTINGTVGISVNPGQTLNNDAIVRFTSLPGDPGQRSPYNTSSSERTGADGPGGALNDYANRSVAPLQIFAIAPQKSLVATSEGHTSGADLTIGEIARFRMVVQLPRSTSPNLQLVDALPPGLLYLNDGTTLVAFVSADGTGITSGGPLGIAGPGLNVASLLNPPTDVTPTFVLPAANISGGTGVGGAFQPSDDPVFSLGDVVNQQDPANPNAEFVVLEFNALVSNISGNQDATTLPDTFTVRINGVQSGLPSNTVTLTVVEPAITNLVKAITTTPTDAGDTIVYSITFSNTGNATAFNLVVSDTLSGFLDLESVTVVAPTASTVTDTSTLGVGGTVQIEIDQLPTVAAIGSGPTGVTVTVTARVIPTAPAGQTIPNVVNLTYTSLPGPGGTVGNPTGSNTPGASGASNGERNGSGGVNDYSGTANVSTTLNTPTLVKLAPTPATYTIGDTVTYNIRVTLPEGVTQALTVTDSLPAGLGYLSSQVITTAAASGGLLTEDFSGTINTSPAVSGAVTFTFGDTTVTATPGTAANQFIMRVVARVLDVPGNVGLPPAQTVLTNTASLTYTNPNTGQPVTVGGGSQNVTVVEPRLETTKTVSPTSGVQAGDTLTYTFTLRNTGTSTAYNVVAVDTMPTPAGVITFGALVPANTCTLDAAPVTVNATVNVPGNTITFTGATPLAIPVGSVLSCTYTATATNALFINGSYTNTVSPTYSSQDPTSPDAAFARTYSGPAAQATFTTPAPTFTKSDGGGAPDVRTIGDVVTYTLTITSPLGTIRDLTITDVLPPGVSYIAGSTAITGLSTAFTEPAGPNPLTWTFGDTLVTASPATIVFQARVDDVPGNAAGVTLINTATLTYSDGAGTPQPPLVSSDDFTIAEPQLTTEKSVNPTSDVQAGDTLTYTFTLRNTGTSTAYNVVAVDTMPTPAGVITFGALVPANTCTLDSAPVTVNAAVDVPGNTITFTGAAPLTIPVGSALTCTYTATVQSSILLGGSYTNTVSPTYGSQDPNGPNAPFARTYSGPAAQATFTTPGVVVSFTKTDDGGTPDTRTIGETITYTLSITSPLGTLRDLVVTDVLPAGLIYNVGSFSVTGISTTPTFTASAPNDGTAAVTLTWDFGDAVVTASPATIQFTAIVANVIGNQAGDVRVNDATLNYSDAAGTPQPPLTDSDDFTIVEPVLTINKAITSIPAAPQAGDTVTYEVVIANPGGATGSTAHDVVFSDTLPAVLLPGTVSFTVSGGASTPVNTSSGQTVSATIASIPPGGSVTITYTATIQIAAEPEQTIVNTAGVTWTSLAGTTPESGAFNGERTGGGGVNDYNAESGQTFQMAGIGLAKALFATSAPHTDGSDVTIGETATYALIVTLPQGTTPALNVTDNLPAGVAYVPGSGRIVTAQAESGTPPLLAADFGGTVPAPTITTGAGTVAFDFGPISVNADGVANNNSFLILLEVTVQDVPGNSGLTPPGQTTLVNSATATAGTATVTSNDVTLTVVEPRLIVTKQFTPSEQGINLPVSITLTVENTGTAAAFDTVISDPLPSAIFTNITEGTTPAGFVFSTAVVGPNTVVTYTATPGTAIAVGETVTFTFSATPTGQPDPGDVIPNTATAITTTLPGDDPGERTEPPAEGSDDLEIIAPDLAIQKSDTPDPVTPNSILTYTLLVTNNGPIAAADVQVVDTLPAGVSLISTATTQGVCTSAGPVVTCDLGAMPASGPGSTVTITITVLVQPSTLGTLVNTATVSTSSKDRDPDNNADTEPTEVVPAADLAVTKTDGVTTYTAPGTLTYTIVVTNLGPSDVVGATVTDTFPPQIASVTWTCTASTGSACGAPSGTGDINTTVDLLRNGTATFTVTATVSASATGTLTNTVTVAPPPGVIDPNPDNNTATDVDAPAGSPIADLTITKTDGVTVYPVPGTLTYTIVVTNLGPSPVTGAWVTDTFPPVLTGVTWNCDVVPPTGGGTCAAVGTQTGDIDTTVDLPVGATVTFTVTATVPDGTTVPITNTARIDPPEGVTDPNPGNNSASDTDLPPSTPQADLTIQKDNGRTVYTPGAPTTYTITVRNLGPSDVTGATVTDTFPPTLTGITWTCTATAGSSCGAANGTGDINTTVNLLVNGVAVFTVNATVDPLAAGTITNVATVAPPPGIVDPNPGDNSDDDTDVPPSPGGQTADLAITKDDGVVIYPVPGTLTYTIVVSNLGPDPVTGATVTDTFPPALTDITWDCYTVPPTGGGTCAAAGTQMGNINTTVDLPVGATVTFTVTVTVPDGTTGTITNTARIDPPQGVTDPNPDNNSDTDVDAPPGATVADLAIFKTDGQTTYVPGAPITYTIQVVNNGPDDVTGAPVTDFFPPQLLDVTWTCAATPGSACGAVTGTGTINTTVDLLRNGTATFTVSAFVDPTATGTLINTATVAPPPGVVDPDPDNNGSTDIDTLGADLAISKDDGVTFYVPGGTLTYTIVVSNLGPSDVVGALVTDFFPPQLTSVTWTCTASVGSSCAVPGGTGDIVTAVNLLAGGTAIFTVNAVVATDAAVNIANTAVVTPPSGIVDPTPENNTATDIDQPVGGGLDVVDPAIVKLVDPALALPGEAVVYTVTVTNNGTQPATGVIVTDPIPDVLEIITVTISQGTYTINGNTVTWNVGMLNPGQTVTMTIQAMARPDVQPPVDVRNVALLTWNEGSQRDSSAMLRIGRGVLPATGYAPEGADVGPASVAGIAGAAVGLTLIGLALLRRRSRRRA